MADGDAPASTASDQARTRDLPGSPLYGAFGVTVEAAGDGMARYRLRPTPETDAAIAGGAAGEVSTFAITTAVDLALVTAASTTIRRGLETMNGTAEMNVTHVAHASGGVLVEAHVSHRDDRIAAVEVRATDESGTLVALGRGTYSFRPSSDGGAS